MRIAIAGVSGAGKSTLAGRLSRMLNLPYTELDSLYHGPGWIPRRTVRRHISREELWNGNREGPLREFFTDRDHIIRWAIRTRRKLKTMVPATAAAHPALLVVRLRSQRDVDEWVKSVTTN